MAITQHFFFFFDKLIPYSSADSLEEIVGLDIGYTGGKAALHTSSGELETIDEYLQEYEQRKRERAYVFANRKSLLTPIPASSVHNPSMHGHSYHGRKVITPTMINSLDASSSSQIGANNKNSTHSMDGSGRIDKSDTAKSETSVHSLRL
jgi:hypothetical protein